MPCFLPASTTSLAGDLIMEGAEGPFTSDRCTWGAVGPGFCPTRFLEQGWGAGVRCHGGQQVWISGASESRPRQARGTVAEGDQHGDIPGNTHPTRGKASTRRRRYKNPNNLFLLSSRAQKEESTRPCRAPGGLASPSCCGAQSQSAPPGRGLRPAERHRLPQDREQAAGQNIFLVKK